MHRRIAGSRQRFVFSNDQSRAYLYELDGNIGFELTKILRFRLKADVLAGYGRNCFPLASRR